jgi:hypothetical protein
MALAELETLGRLRLSLAVVVFNVATLSLIAIKQRRNAAEATERSPTPPPTLPPSAWIPRPSFNGMQSALDEQAL